MQSQWLRASISLPRIGSAGAARPVFTSGSFNCSRLCANRYYLTSTSVSTPSPPASSPPPPSIPPPSISSSTSISSSISPLSPSKTAIQPSILETSPRRRELHSLLMKLREYEETFNTTEMYLATQQLQEENPLLKISVVGLEQSSQAGESDSERIAKLLLIASNISSSPLEKLKELEKHLKGSTSHLSGIAIRYGAKVECHYESFNEPEILRLPHPLLKPSTSPPVRPPLEVTVASLDVSDPHSTPLDFEVIASKMGIAYAVHRSFVIVRNLEELLSSKRLLWESKGAGERERVRIVVDVDRVTYDAVQKFGQNVAEGRRFICSAIAEQALVNLRKGRGSNMDLISALEESGITKLVEDIKSETTIASTEREPLLGDEEVDRLPKYVKDLIHTILSYPLPDKVQHSSIISGISSSTSAATLTATSRNDNSKKSLSGAVSAWSRASHTELTRELDIGYSRKPYTRLRWWKLLWNVDEVFCGCEAVIRGYFLRDAEKKGWFLAGRVAGAGYSLPENVEIAKTAAELLPPEETSSSETSINANTLNSTIVETSTGDIKPIPSSHLNPSQKNRAIEHLSQSQYPSHITESRQRIIQTTIPPLHRKAQMHLAKFLSSATLASATGILMYMSEFSLYTSFSVFSLIGVYSLRRLQVGWGRDIRDWQRNVRDEGRKAIAGVEGWVETCLISDNGTNAVEIAADDGKTSEEKKEADAKWYKKRNEVYRMLSRAKKLLEEL